MLDNLSFCIQKNFHIFKDTLHIVFNLIASFYHISLTN